MFQQLVNQSYALLTASTLLMLFLHTKPADAGNCWMSIRNGRCQGLIKTQVSHEACCNQAVPSGTPYFTPEDVSSGTLFYYRNLAGGAPNCQACAASCDSVQCGEGKKCRMRRGHPKCICAPNCSEQSIGHRGEICGSNGQSFRSHCSLLKYNCRHNKDVQVAYFGRCKIGSCDDITCSDPTHTCVLDQNNMPHCFLCNTECPVVTDPSHQICGADGNTYPSLCRLRAAACYAQKAISIAYRGRCQESLTCETLSCAAGQSCLMNLETEQPQCVSCGSNCLLGTSTAKLCGNNGRTYNSWCAMRQASCASGVVIQTRHAGECGNPQEHTALYEDSSLSEDR